MTCSQKIPFSPVGGADGDGNQQRAPLGGKTIMRKEEDCLGFSNLFRRPALSVQTGRGSPHPFSPLEDYTPLCGCDGELYACLREAVPIIDAAIDKIVRLTGGFTVLCEEEAVREELCRFLSQVPVSGGQTGIAPFLASYLDSLLTYGSAVGESLPGEEGVLGLYNAPCRQVTVKPGQSPMELCFYVPGEEGLVPVREPQWILFSALRPNPGEIRGNSLLKGLPFVSDILLKIFRSIGNNFERIANLRYAVTYKPGAGSLDRAYSQEIAASIAKEWQNAMNSGKSGSIRDFVAVGDVDVKVIGADNQMIDTQVPVRQMLEQMVAKLGIPPFLLGLNWSTTERMSAQQADILTSELEYYRSLLTPVVEKVCRSHLLLKGMDRPFSIDWDCINLQDEVELANTRLIQLQADRLERENKEAMDE